MTLNTWYIYQNNQQLGPFEQSQIQQLLATKMIAHESHIFKAGWVEWRLVKDCMEEIHGTGQFEVEESSLTGSKINQAARRVSFEGRVVAHNQKTCVQGKATNISASGLFVQASEPIFTIGEELKVSIRGGDLAKPFNATADVVRFNSDSRFPLGYGLRFQDLEGMATSEIERMVEKTTAV